MNAETDIPALVAAARSPALPLLEAQLAEAEASHAVVYRNLAIQQEAANPSFQSPMRVKTGATIAAAEEKIAELTATAAALQKTAADLRRRIGELKPASGAAVAEALSPLRRQAANDMAIAARAFCAAAAKFNAISLALEQNGVPALQLPASLQILDHLVEKAMDAC